MVFGLGSDRLEISSPSSSNSSDDSFGVTAFLAMMEGSPDISLWECLIHKYKKSIVQVHVCVEIPLIKRYPDVTISAEGFFS